jgi:hypothetical protein
MYASFFAPLRVFYPNVPVALAKIHAQFYPAKIVGLIAPATEVSRRMAGNTIVCRRHTLVPIRNLTHPGKIGRSP